MTTNLSNPALKALIPSEYREQIVESIARETARLRKDPRFLFLGDPDFLPPVRVKR